jgi:hypothetical protein
MIGLSAASIYAPLAPANDRHDIDLHNVLENFSVGNS